MEVPENKQWCVLEFQPREPGGVIEVSVIPAIWKFQADNKEYCYYPRKPQWHLASKLAREYTEPDVGKWDKWGVKKTLGMFNDFDVARRFEEYSTIHSDVDESVLPLSKKQRAARHRKVVDTESDTEPATEDEGPIPPPPVFTKAGAGVKVGSNSDSTATLVEAPHQSTAQTEDNSSVGESSNSLPNYPPLQEDELPPAPQPPQANLVQTVVQDLPTPQQITSQSPQLQNLSTPQRSNTSNQTQRSSPEFTAEQPSTSPLAQFSYLTASIDVEAYSDVITNESNGNSRSSTVQQDTTPTSTRRQIALCTCGAANCEKRDFHEFVTREVKLLHQKINYLVSIAKEDKKVRQEEDNKLTLRYTFPISSVESFEALNDELEQNRASSKQMIEFFASSCASNSIKDCTYQILRRVLSSEVAMCYNWENRNGGKRPMKDMKFHQLMYEALRQKPNLANVTIVEVQNHLKEWCRQAKPRTKKAKDDRNKARVDNLSPHQAKKKRSSIEQENLENTPPSNIPSTSTNNIQPTTQPSHHSPQLRENQDTHNSPPTQSTSDATWLDC